MSKISDALARLKGSELEIKRGTPATDAQVAALEKRLGCRLPGDYIAFLKEHGALAVGWRVTAFGHAPGNDALDVVAAAKTIAREFEEWGQDPVVVTPCIASQHFPSEGHVLDGGGAVQWFRRGQLEPRERSFEDLVVERLERAHDDEQAEQATAKSQRDVLMKLAALVPKQLRTTPDADPSHRLVLRRPSDGVDIEVRFGDGREYHTGIPGLFIFWTEPTPKTLEAMNAWNRGTRIVRGTVQEGRNRYRGRLPAVGLDLAQLVNVLADEAGLPLPRMEPHERPLTLDALEEAFRGATQTRSPPLPREGGELVTLSSDRGSRTHAPLALYLSPTADGLVRVRHTTQSEAPGAELLEAVNALNGRSLSDHDVNFDMEPIAHVTVDGGAVTFSFVTTRAAFTNGSYVHAARDLVDIARKSGLLAPPDLIGERAKVLEELVQVPAGPVSRALLGAVDATGSGLRLSFGFGSKSAFGRDQPVETPWGSVTPFLQVEDRELGVGTSIEVGLVTRDGATSDACRVVGLNGNHAVLLARDLKSFLSVAVLGTTGFAHDGDDDRVWRTYRDRCSRRADLPEHFFFAGRRLCRAIGAEPARSVTAVLDAAGTPRHAEVSRG